MKKKLLLIVWAFVATHALRAQYDPSYSHYWMLERTFNPATAGKDPAMLITAAYSMQMSGFENAPSTMYAGVDLPLFFLNPKHGLGATFLNDEIGLFSHKRFSIQYAFHQPLWGGVLSIGVQGDMVSETFDGSKADVEDPNDPAIATSSINGSAFDMATGLYYQHRNWYAGISMQHVLGPKVELGETNELKIDPTYYFTAGYNIKLRSPFITIHPTMLAKYDGVDYRIDLTGRVEYKRDNKRIYGGAGYNPQNSVMLFVGGVFHGVELTYSYEAYTSVPGLKSGAHELAVSYRMDLDLGKKGRNRHKNVRIL